METMTSTSGPNLTLSKLPKQLDTRSLRVECVVLAEFDIDVGSSLAAKFPPDFLQNNVDGWSSEKDEQ